MFVNYVSAKTFTGKMHILLKTPEVEVYNSIVTPFAIDPSEPTIDQPQPHPHHIAMENTHHLQPSFDQPKPALKQTKGK